MQVFWAGNPSRESPFVEGLGPEAHPVDQFVMRTVAGKPFAAVIVEAGGGFASPGRARDSDAT